MIKIDALIPSKDEPTLKKVVEKLKRLNFINQIIVIDDGSREKVEIKDEKIKVIRFEKSRGKTRAIKEGFKHSQTEFLLLQDADLEYPVENVEQLYTYMPEYHMIVARRFVPVDQITFSGVIANRIITWLLKEPDVFSGQRIVHRKLLESINLEGRWSLETKLTLEARKQKLKVKYVDCLYYPRSYREGKKIKPWDMLEILVEVARYGRNP